MYSCQINVPEALVQVGKSAETPLEETLRRRILADGPIPFSAYMHAALYHPTHGYYTSGRPVWGAAGDYVTAPGVHPAYGRAVARLADELDVALGRPDRFDLVEAGGGEGRLLRIALETLAERRPDLYRRTRAGLVERGAAARRQAVQGLPEPGRGLWSGDELGGAGLRGLVFCNELLDAFPVERVRCRDGRLEQSRIDVAGEGLVERFTAPVDPAVRRYLEDGGVELGDGQVAEVCLEVGRWLQRVDALLQAGALLVVDYGHETAALYGPERRHGTLVTMRRFVLGDDPLADPGLHDLTAQVDLGNLRRRGRDLGLHVQGPCSLRVFLLGMGAAEEPPADPRERLALRHLLVSELGDAHKAMLLTRGLAPETPAFGRRRLEVPAAGVDPDPA